MAESDVQPQVVLVIDDEDSFREMTVRALEPLGVHVFAAPGGIEGINLARRKRPDLILLDYGMPDLSGTEICQRIQEDRDLAGVPILVLVKRGDTQARIDALESGAIDCIAKPFLQAEFQARVRTQLRMRQLHRSMESMRSGMRERQRAEFVQTFAVGVAHNFNNLLTAGLGFLSLGMELAQDRTQLLYLRNLELSLRRMGSLAKQLLSFTGDLATQKRSVPVRQVIRNALTLFDHVALKSRIVTVCDLAGLGEASVICDEFLLTHAVLQLLHNAREAVTRESARIFLNASREDAEVVIEIIDQGRGMTPERVARARDPFFTTKMGVGVGLGLSMVDGVTRDLGGQLLIESRPGRGTSVRMVLPAAPAESQAPRRREGRLRRRIRALLAVDAEETRQALEAVLAAQHCYVDLVESQEELLARVRSAPGSYEVVVIDLLRGSAFGDELISLLRAETEMPILCLVSTPMEMPSRQPGVRVVRKPFGASELLDALESFPALVEGGGVPREGGRETGT